MIEVPQKYDPETGLAGGLDSAHSTPAPTPTVAPSAATAGTEDPAGLERQAFEIHNTRDPQASKTPPPGYVVGPEHYGEIAYKFIQSAFAGSSGLLNSIKDEVTGAKADREAKASGSD